jgi:hypothetical protein
MSISNVHNFVSLHKSLESPNISKENFKSRSEVVDLSNSDTDDDENEKNILSSFNQQHSKDVQPIFPDDKKLQIKSFVINNVHFQDEDNDTFSVFYMVDNFRSISILYKKKIIAIKFRSITSIQ